MTLRVRADTTDVMRLFDKTRAIRSPIREGMERFAEDIILEMKRRAPVDTGRLRDSISWKWVGDTLTIETGEDLPYPVYVEFGTYKMAASPFFFPVIDEFRPRLQEYMKRVVEDMYD